MPPQALSSGLGLQASAALPIVTRGGTRRGSRSLLESAGKLTRLGRHTRSMYMFTFRMQISCRCLKDLVDLPEVLGVV